MFSVGRLAWSRFVRISRPYLTSECRRQAYGLLAVLVGLLLAISGLNVAISYVGRDFMTAIALRQPHQVFVFSLFYLAAFAVSTAAGAFAQYAELLLGLRWREWLTRSVFHRYLASQAYRRLNAQSDVDNPDERIAEDLKTFTTTTLSFLVMAINSAITVFAFAGVLWSITPWLLLAGVLYPLLGTSLIVFAGRRLVKLSHLQLKKEADFRFALVHVRAHADAIALDQAEMKEEPRLVDRLHDLVENYYSIIRVLRNLKFVTGGYNYLDQLIPVFIVAPLYLRGQVEFGVVTQAAMAFSQIFNAFSLIAERFQDLSAFAAVIGRVGALDEAIAESAQPSRRPIEVVKSDAPVAFQRLTLRAPPDDHVLVQDISLEVPRGQRVLVTGPNRAGQRALFRAAAGMWDQGEGRIVQPTPRRVMFLPEQPYLVPGNLRDQFLTAAPQGELADERILEVVRAVGLETLLDLVGGLDARQDWTALALAERQRIAFARLLLAEPDFAFLDHAASALSDAQQTEIYQLLARTGLTYISVGDHHPNLLQFHHTQLELASDGSWAIRPCGAERDAPGSKEGGSAASKSV